MTKMVRKRLFIREEQSRQHKTRAALTGVTDGEIIRRSIDRELALQISAKEEGDWRKAWRQARGMWADYDEADEVIAARRERNRQRMDRIRRQMRGRRVS